MSDLATLTIRVDSLEARIAKRDLESLNSSSGILEQSMGKLRGAIGLLASAFAAMKLADQVKELTLLAARYDTMNVVMLRAGSNAGYTGKQMYEFQKALEETGISMLESRNTLTQLATAHIDLNNAQKLARGAQDLAVVANINSSEAFQRLVHGIKSGQTEILRTMGLNVQFEEGYKRLARELGKTTEQLSGQEKMNARVAITLKEVANYQGIYEDAMGTAGKQAKSLERYMENLQVQIGKVFQPGYSGIVVSLTNALKGMAEWTARNQNQLTAMGLSIENARKALADLWGAITDMNSGIKWFELLRGAIDGIGMGIAFASDAFKGWKIALTETMSSLFMSLAKGAEAIAQFYNAMPGGSRAAADATKVMDFLVGVGLKYDAITQKTGNSTSAVDAWMKAHREAEKIAKEGPLAFDGPGRDEQAANPIPAEEEIAKSNKEFQKLLENLQKEVDTYGMSKTAILGYEAAKMKLGPTQTGQLEALANTLDDLEAEKRRADDARKAEQELSDAIKDQTKARIDRAYQQKIELENEGKRLQEQMQTPEERRVSELQKLDALLKGNAITRETYQRKLIEIEKTGGTMFGTLLQGVDLFAQHGAEAFERFAMTGKLAWRDMINAIIADLVRLQAQKAFQQLAGYAMSALGAYFGGGNSTYSGMSGTPDWTFDASGGGGVTSTGGSWTPGIAAGGKGGMAPAAGGGVSVSVVVNGDGSSKVSTDGSGQNAAMLGRSIGYVVEQKILEHKRPGGLLWENAYAG